MGICLSNNDENTRAIDVKLRQDGRKDADIIKLLFLGAGGSGKSTLFKQLRLIHSQGLGEVERQGFTIIIHKNLFDGFRALIPGLDEVAEAGGEDWKEAEHLVFSSEEASEAAARVVKNAQQESRVSKECAEDMKKVWNDKGIKYLWDNHRSKIQVQDSVAHFMDRIDAIIEENYIPTAQDVLHVRNRTTGIVEQAFTIRNRPFLIVDVGGQRSERKKWIKCFTDVTGIIFVASLAGYDRVLYEDESTLRMNESLKVFRDLTNENMTTFQDTAIILFLNKSDLFEAKIKAGQHIKDCFDEYQGDLTSIDASYDFIMRKFLEQNTVTDRKIFVHKTCATDTKQMQHIFDAVNHTIINRALVKAGLLVQS